MSHDLACMSSKVQQQLKLLRRQVNWLPLHRNRVRRFIDNEVACLQSSSGALWCTTQMGSHAREQLLNAEWLRHIIVSAGVEGFNFGVLVVPHRQNENRRR